MTRLTDPCSRAEQVFAQQLQQFDKVRSRKAFVTEYQREPMFEKGLEPFDEARAVVRELIDEYRAAEKPEYVVRFLLSSFLFAVFLCALLKEPPFCPAGLWRADVQRGAGSAATPVRGRRSWWSPEVRVRTLLSFSSFSEPVRTCLRSALAVLYPSFLSFAICGPRVRAGDRSAGVDSAVLAANSPELVLPRKFWLRLRVSYQLLSVRVRLSSQDLARPQPQQQ